MMLLFEHHAKIVSIYAMKSLQYHSTLVFINHVIISTHSMLDSLCFDDSAAYSTGLLSLGIQC
jgi:hypothetical protein